jgi:hypothetical protein
VTVPDVEEEYYCAYPVDELAEGGIVACGTLVWNPQQWLQARVDGVDVRKFYCDDHIDEARANQDQINAD